MNLLLVVVLLLLPMLAPAQPVFGQITSGDVAQDEGTFSGAVWGDFNNDGFLDL